MVLYDLDKRFNVQPVRERQFFSEWQMGLPEPTASEKHRLDRAKQQYLYLSTRPMPEEIVGIAPARTTRLQNDI
ncbi:MAG: hypothetical protein EDM05_040740 [Leptolyngbya sp. IPPAS B-1204]